MNQAELNAGSLEQRGHAYRDQQPGVDHEDQGTQQAEARDVRGKRLLHRVAILTGVCTTVLLMLAWTAFLLYGVVWVVHRVA